MTSPSLFRIFTAWLASLAILVAGEPHPATITQIKAVDLGFDLPRSIINRHELTRLESPEYNAALKAREPELMKLLETNQDDLTQNSWLETTTVSKAADGAIFLADSGNMALWLRRGESWECLLHDIHVSKTFGGAPPYLPVLYLGNGYFAFSKTIRFSDEDEGPNRFPTAQAITYLLDSSSGRIIDRSPAFQYDHNPPVKIPEEWYTRTQTTPLPKN